jgi:hypothetical protein
MNISPNPEPALVSVHIPHSGFAHGSIWETAVDDAILAFVDYVIEDRQYLEATFDGLAHVPTEEIDFDRLREAVFEAMDYRRAYEHLAREYVAELADWLSDTLDMEVLAEFEEVVSPRYYNFETDRVFAKISLSAMQEIARRLAADPIGRAALRDTIRERHTSRDGFASWYSGNPDSADWHKPVADMDHNELGTLLRAWVLYNGIEDLDMELYDRSIGGLYEEVQRAVDAGLDINAVRLVADRMGDEWTAEQRARDPAFMPPTPRCPLTLELSL